MNAHYREREREREQLAREALGLWVLYAKRYRENPRIYRMLLEEKKRLKIPIRRGETLCKAVWEDYPKIPFLDEENQEIVWEELGKMNLGELMTLIRQLEDLESNYAYRAVAGLIIDFRYQINQHGKPRPTFAFDPNFRSSGGGNRKARRTSSIKDGD